MNSLSFYLDAAEKAIARWGYRAMLLDEDSISEVAYQMMKADASFNGKGSAYGWRGYCARLTIMKLCKKKRNPHMSLDANLYRLVEDKKSSKALYEMQDCINHTKSINSLERKALNMYYFQGMTFEEVANATGLKSRQRAYQVIDDALSKIKREVL